MSDRTQVVAFQETLCSGSQDWCTLLLDAVPGAAANSSFLQRDCANKRVNESCQSVCFHNADS